LKCSAKGAAREFFASLILPRSFYARPTVEVARGLLGKVLVHDLGRGTPLAGRIVETEAYLGSGDRAAHAWRGVTPRTRVLFGPPGHAYVYLIYGMYECLNIVAEAEGVAGCALIRAVEPTSGIGAAETNGPGKLARALRITRRFNGTDLTLGPLTVREPEEPGEFEIGVSPRIGITHCADLPLRFFVRGSTSLSRKERRMLY
jgi:DNA-3-methyladenine glycosylase